MSACQVCSNPRYDDTAPCAVCGASPHSPAAFVAPGQAPPAPPVPHQPPQYAPPAPHQQWGAPQYGAPPYGTPQYGTPQWGPPPYGAVPTKTPKAAKWIGVVVAAFVVVAVIAGFVGVSGWLSSDEDALATLDGPWEPVTSRSGRYSLSLPLHPDYFEKTLDVDGVSMPLVGIYCGDGDIDNANVGMIFMEQDMSLVGLDPALAAEAFDAMLDGMASGSIEGMGGTVDSVERVTSELGPAGTFTGRLEREHYAIAGFVVLDGTTAVTIMAILPDDIEDPPERYLDNAVITLERN